MKTMSCFLLATVARDSSMEPTGASKSWCVHSSIKIFAFITAWQKIFSNSEIPPASYWLSHSVPLSLRDRYSNHVLTERRQCECQKASGGP